MLPLSLILIQRVSVLLILQGWRAPALYLDFLGFHLLSDPSVNPWLLNDCEKKSAAWFASVRAEGFFSPSPYSAEPLSNLNFDITLKNELILNTVLSFLK
jgi:hypothetical protein